MNSLTSTRSWRSKTLCWRRIHVVGWCFHYNIQKFGRCTRNMRLLSGRLKKLILPKTTRIGFLYQKLGGGNWNIFLFLPVVGGKDPIWRAYFSGGLKRPTRKVSSILSSMSWHSLQLLMVSSWRIWRNSFLPKYRSQKQGLFMDSKLLWKTSILRPIPCSLSSTSKIPRRRMILSLAGGVCCSCFRTLFWGYE